ncbi:response regulator [Emticicia sp. SJ17W-69]|uniref:response regulator n=1 Tax=Emticicia sp. SJ17W-69 TaxID=3421657 RepID=UPI003EB90D5E
MNKPLNVVLADQHPSMLKGISAELENDRNLIVVACTQHIEEIEKKLISNRVDVLVLDYWFRESNTQSIIKKLRVKYPVLKIILYTQEERLSYVKEVLENIHGYILKTEPEGSLTMAIQRVIQNKKAISEDIRESLEAGANVNHSLSSQENKILYCRIEGMNPLTISEQLSISEKTVRKHIDNARKKLGFVKTEDMIRWFWKQNI